MRSPKILFLTLLVIGLSVATVAGLDFLNFNGQASINSTVFVKGGSLAPILNPGDELTIDTKYFRVNGIDREDIVIYQYSKLKPNIAKIVKAIPGDEFHLEGAFDDKYYIVVNGSILTNSEKEAYLIVGKRAEMISLYEESYAGKIPDKTYLLLGNKIGGTFDSTVFGLVSEDDILGRVQL